MTRFRLTHLIIPSVVFCVILAGIAWGDLDSRIAQSWAYDPARGWIGAHTWWAYDLIHQGGRVLVFVVTIIAALAALVRRWRRPALYVVACILLSTGLVGLLKSQSNVDCPWNLAGFGGKNPYVEWFQHRPPGLPRAQCFPGAHSSSGFALMCFYFVLRSSKPRFARLALAGGLLTGAVFAFGQEARGAHFLSHDLTSAAIVWWVLLSLSPIVDRSPPAEPSPTA
jgi:membrane-associated PAP2 superfamily phosphatase